MLREIEPRQKNDTRETFPGCSVEKTLIEIIIKRIITKIAIAIIII